VPAAVVSPGGPYNVICVTSNGSFTLTSAYTFIAAPTITSITPVNQGPFAGGTAVTISGTNYGDSASPPNSYVSAVLFDGLAASSVVVTASGTLTCVTPASSLVTSNGNYPVSVEVITTGGTATQNNYFTYVPLPTITNLSPVIGLATGGTSVSINGTHFTNATFVYFGKIVVGTTSNRVVPTVTTDGNLTCTSPAHVAGLVSVSVVAPGGTATLNNAYTFEAVPTISKVTPNTGPTAGGQAISITGTNFIGATLTFVDNISHTTIYPTSVVVTASKITAVTPANAADAVDVVVTTPVTGGTATDASGYTYFVAPVIDGYIGNTSFPTTLPDATKGTAYSETMQATQTVTSWTALGLPAGLTIVKASGVISGTPTAAGGYSVTITATNGGGSDTKTFSLNVIGTGTSAPVLQSAATAFPNPATAGESVSFQAAASDSDGDKLSYTWYFGDGTMGSAASTTHIFASEGTYTATVVVSDGLVANDVQSSITIIVNTISVKTCNIRFSFSSANSDTVAVTGTMTGLLNFNPTNQLVVVELGNFTPFTVMLNKSGTGVAVAPTADKSKTFKLLGVLKNGKYTKDAVPFSMSMSKQALFADLTLYGYQNVTIPKTAPRSVEVPLTLTINGGVYLLEMKTSYTATLGKTGTAVIRR